METEALKAFALDFARRTSSLDWLTDAVMIAGMIPSTDPTARPGTRTIRDHVILIGPTTDAPPPVAPLARSTRGTNDWIRVPPPSPAVTDVEKWYDVIATGPLPIKGRAFNFVAVHFTRRHGSGGYVRYLFAHREDMEEPGTKERLASDAWVHDVLSVWLDEAPDATK